MDPNAALAKLLDALAAAGTHRFEPSLLAADRAEVIESLRDLLRWVEQGGFLPDNPCGDADAPLTTRELRGSDTDLVEHARKLLQDPDMLADAQRGHRVGNTVVGSVMALTTGSPRWATEEAVRQVLTRVGGKKTRRSTR